MWVNNICLVSYYESQTHSVYLLHHDTLNYFLFYFFIILLTILQIQVTYCSIFLHSVFVLLKDARLTAFYIKSCPLAVLGARVTFSEIMHFPGPPSLFTSPS